MIASPIDSVMAKDACEYVTLKIAELEENPFFQGIKAYLFSGGFISTLEEYGEVCQHMTTPRYQWDGLILAHIIAEEFKKRSPHLPIAIESLRVSCLQILYKIYQDYEMNSLSHHE
jgi:hypothetical protein